MTIARSLLSEFDREMAGTRRVLERVPLERGDFRPHPKSKSLAELAGHLAELVSWGAFTFQTEVLDFAEFEYREPRFATRAELLATFDQNAAGARAAVEAADDATALAPWTLRHGERVFFTRPRLAVVRDMVLSHMIHHRAQLTVYLRLLDVPVPGLYGPSADEA